MSGKVRQTSQTPWALQTRQTSLRLVIVIVKSRNEKTRKREDCWILRTPSVIIVPEVFDGCLFKCRLNELLLRLPSDYL